MAYVKQNIDWSKATQEEIDRANADDIFNPVPSFRPAKHRIEGKNTQKTDTRTEFAKSMIDFLGV